MLSLQSSPGGEPMNIHLVVLTIAIASALGISAVSAQDYPFCLNSCNNGGCTFSTLQQCQATASGIEGTCVANPNYRPTKEAQPVSHARVARKKL
jgi:uncharacterized protein DUF3551